MTLQEKMMLDIWNNEREANSLWNEAHNVLGPVRVIPLEDPTNG